MILLALLLADPMGQHHGMAMPGMTMPAASPAPAKKPSGRGVKRSTRKPAPSQPTLSQPTPRKPPGRMTHDAMPGMTMPSCSAEHAAMGHCRSAPAIMAGEPGGEHPAAMPDRAMEPGGCPPEHAAMGHCRAGPVKGESVVGKAPPPPAPTSRAADRFYDPTAMAVADRRMRMEHGGMRFSQILFNLAELRVRDGRDGYRWDGEGWFGGDIHRLVVKTEGEGTLGDRVGAAEVQALYARAIDPYWNLQAGLRQDVGQGARRTYAVVGVEGLAPYWFDVEGALFLSDRGDVLARGEAWVDQRMTQRAVLQPRVEVNLAAQDVPDQRIAAGVSDIELGLRLRYEIAREFAPYVGVGWERRYGPAAGGGVALALGIRTWF